MARCAMWPRVPCATASNSASSASACWPPASAWRNCCAATAGRRRAAARCSSAWSIHAARRLHDYLARRGVLTRQFEQPASLRLGLPADEAAWARLDAALLGFKEPAHA